MHNIVRFFQGRMPSVARENLLWHCYTILYITMIGIWSGSSWPYRGSFHWETWCYSYHDREVFLCKSTIVEYHFSTHYHQCLYRCFRCFYCDLLFREKVVAFEGTNKSLLNPNELKYLCITSFHFTVSDSYNIINPSIV